MRKSVPLGVVAMGIAAVMVGVTVYGEQAHNNRQAKTATRLANLPPVRKALRDAASNIAAFCSIRERMVLATVDDAGKQYAVHIDAVNCAAPKDGMIPVRLALTAPQFHKRVETHIEYTPPSAPQKLAGPAPVVIKATPRP